MALKVGNNFGVSVDVSNKANRKKIGLKSQNAWGESILWALLVFIELENNFIVSF